MNKWLDKFLSNLFTGGIFGGGLGALDSMKAATDQTQTENILSKAEEDPLGAQGQLAQGNYQLTAEQEKWLDNLISQQNTQSARDWEEQMSSTDLLRAANQLEQLGLSSSGVLQTGGSSTNAVAAADNSKTNVAAQKYAQRMALAKSLLGMTSQMASAGIYGHALGAARHASSVVTSAAAHSGLRTLQSVSRDSEPPQIYDREYLLSELENM